MIALSKPVKYGILGVGMTIFGILLGWVIFPAILTSQLKKQMALSAKTDIRQMWEKIPFALDFKVFFFNYTNVEEIQKGAAPIVKEIGPYYFEEWKEKVEIEDHPEDDTITYKKRDMFLFRPDLSGPGLTGEEVITLPHIFILSMIITIYREKPAMLNVVNKALDGIFDQPTDVFMRAKALDLLFRGVVINCARTEFAPKAACTQIKKEALSNIVYEPNNQFRFSLFGTRNNTIDPHVVTVKRGIKNVMDVGSVVAIDGAPQLDIWKDSCNEYQGTDGTVFPPFLTKDDRLQSFSGDLCRSFKPWYQKKSFYAGIATNRYIADIGDFANDPELQCFCEAPDKCPPKGMMDLTKCMKAPMWVSLPHFLGAPDMQDNVKGLNPDTEQHEIQIDFEPISGTPMSAKQRVQFSIELLKTDKMPLCKELPGTIAPLFWIEEGLGLNKTFVNMVKYQLIYPKRFVTVLRWWLIASGLLTTLLSIINYFSEDFMRLATAGSADNKVTAVDEQDKDISVIGQGQDPAKVTM